MQDFAALVSALASLAWPAVCAFLLVWLRGPVGSMDERSSMPWMACMLPWSPWYRELSSQQTQGARLSSYFLNPGRRSPSDRPPAGVKQCTSTRW